MNYFVVFIEYHRAIEAIVDPEVTRREIISRIKSGEYQNIHRIHHVDDLLVEDVTFELIEAAEQELKDEVRARKAARAA
jgi:GMP synthase PP-ATPase subunit